MLQKLTLRSHSEAFPGQNTHILAAKSVSELIPTLFFGLNWCKHTHCHDMLRKSESLPAFATELFLSV
jgi:hypothetical protein